MTHPIPSELRVTLGNRLPIAPDEPWRDSANCLGTDPDLFFSSHGTSWATKLDQIAPICDPCPVADECHTHGLTMDDGIYGHDLVRQAGRTIVVERFKHGTVAGYKRHHSRGETACRPCLKANAADVQRRRTA